MIPVSLSIEGLYSYKQKQIIDFTQLTEAGLFGIFGAVGSGKSTILEAMMIALYGETDRIQIRERIGMMNLQSNKVEIEFTFRTGEKLENLFRAHYSIKRKKKDFDSLETPSHHFYQFKNDQWEPLDIKNAGEVLGMKLSDFKRTIIIPQGKFREFVELKDADRSAMLKDLFQLDRFDLSMPVKSLLADTYSKRDMLRTTVMNLGDVSEEAQSQLQLRIEEVGLQISSIQSQITELEKEIGTLQMVDKLFQEWKTLKGLLTQLEAQKVEVEKKKQLLEKSKLVRLNFSIPYQQRADLRFSLEKLAQSISSNSDQLRTWEGRLTALSDQLVLLKSESEKRTEKESRIRHLQALIEMRKLDKRIQELNVILSLSATQRQEWEKKKVELEATLEGIKKELAHLETNSMSDEMYEQLQELVQHYSNATKSRTEEVRKYDALKEQFRIQKEKHQVVVSKWLDADNDTFEKWRSSINEMLVNVQQRKDRIRAQVGLVQYIDQVKENEPCPLCGSLEHPRLAKGDHERLEMLEREETAVRKQLDELSKDESEARVLESPLELMKSQLHDLENTISEIDEGIQGLITRFPDFQCENIDQCKLLLAEADKTKKSFLAQTKQLSTFQNEWNEVSKKLSEDLQKSAAVREELAMLSGKYDSFKSEVTSNQDDWWKKYETVEISVIESDIQKVQARIAQVEKELHEIQNVERELTSQVSTMKGTLQSDTKKYEEDILKVKKLEEQIQQKVESLELEMATVEELLQNPLDEAKVENEIQNFNNEWTRTASRLEILEKESDFNQYDAQVLETKNELLKLKKHSQSEVQKEMGAVSNQLSKMKEDAEKQKSTLEELAKVEARESNLKILESLFKGKGFVSYISNFYLRDLCVSANIRFTELTRHQMAIEVDENNNFYVRDFLNEGRL
ncbi:MAG: SMC family ATPase [Flavobacteriales bacterium]